MDSFDFNCLNHTELFQVCAGAKLNPQPNMTRKELVLLIEREVDPPTTTTVFNSFREGIFHFVDEYWDRIQSQLTCPATQRSITACGGCPDLKVLSCVVVNKSADNFIQLRKK